MRGLRRLPGVQYPVLTPNLKARGDAMRRRARAM